MRRPTIWLVSAYAAVSHRVWADHLIADQPGFDWRRYELTPRRFRWRIRGNPLSWLDVLPDTPPDLIVATSMVDLATLRGIRPELAHVPVLYYFHENQFAYPVSARQSQSLEPQLVQLYGGLAADQLVFNSGFNRDSYLTGIAALIDQRADDYPEGVAERLGRRSTVEPVPIEPVAPASERDPQLVLWNHRWEYDKVPELFAQAILALAEQGVTFRLALLGPRPQPPPEPLARLRARVGDRIVADEWADAATYRHWVARAGIVVSTTRHEFQGLAMLEATSAGARPLVPDALCYPEQYPSAYRYPPGDDEALAGRLRAWLTDGLPARVDTTPWHRDRLAPRWTQRLRHAMRDSPAGE